MQAERTALSWQRTVLALAVASAVAARLLLDGAGPAALLVGAAGLVLGGLLHHSARRRDRSRRSGRADGRMLAATAALALLAALAGVATVLTGVPLPAVP